MYLCIFGFYSQHCFRVSYNLPLLSCFQMVVWQMFVWHENCWNPVIQKNASSFGEFAKRRKWRNHHWEQQQGQDQTKQRDLDIFTPVLRGRFIGALLSIQRWWSCAKRDAVPGSCCIFFGKTPLRFWLESFWKISLITLSTHETIY